MSDQYAAYIAEIGAIRIGNECGLAAFAILLQEYLLTLFQEIDLFWSRKLTGASILFFLNRYIVLVTMFLNISGVLFSVPPEGCGFMVKITNAFALLQYVPWAAFSTTRAFALSARNIPMTLIVFLLTMVPIGANLTNFAFGIKGIYNPVLGCIVVDPISPDLAKKLTIASRTSLIASDAILVLIAWVNVFGRGKINLTWIQKSSSFSTVIIRNGAIYFIVLLSLNVLHLTLTLMIFLEVPFEPASFITQFTHPITGILVWRFLLDLQYANKKALDLDSESLPAAAEGTLIFRRTSTSAFSMFMPPSVIQHDPPRTVEPHLEKTTKRRAMGSGETSEAMDADSQLQDGSSHKVEYATELA